LYEPLHPLVGIAHGITTLILEDQFPHEYLQDQNLKELLKTVIS
jgi:hypothetical protein